MIIFVPENGRRIIITFEISEIRNGQYDCCVKNKDGSFLGKKFFENADHFIFLFSIFSKAYF